MKMTVKFVILFYLLFTCISCTVIPLDGRVVLNPCTGETLLYGDFDVVRENGNVAFRGVLTSDDKYHDYMINFMVSPESSNDVETYKVPLKDATFAILITVDRVHEKVTKMEVTDCQ